jgi:hypothetical protein
VVLDTPISMLPCNVHVKQIPSPGGMYLLLGGGWGGPVLTVVLNVNSAVTSS